MLRLPGFIAAAMYVTAAFLSNMLASDEGDFSGLILSQLATLAFALPLLLPWRIFAGRIRRRVLISWLSLSALVGTAIEINKQVWFFQDRPLDDWATHVLPLSLFIIVGVWMAVLAAVIGRNGPTSRSGAHVKQA